MATFTSKRIPTALSLLALFFAIGGSAIAAKHYLLTSTSQIKPTVLKALKGKNGKTGAAGQKGEQGQRGEKGEPGVKGEEGKAGANGAVAGYSVTQGSGVNITEDESLTPLTGLSKALPAGSFIANATVELIALGPEAKPHEFAGAECALIDKLSGGSETKATGAWASETAPSKGTASAAAEIPLQLAVTAKESSTLSVDCEAKGHGASVKIEALNGSLVAVQTSANS